jgi:hypothetical protein
LLNRRSTIQCPDSSSVRFRFTHGATPLRDTDDPRGHRPRLQARPTARRTLVHDAAGELSAAKDEPLGHSVDDDIPGIHIEVQE